MTIYIAEFINALSSLAYGTSLDFIARCFVTQKANLVTSIPSAPLPRSNAKA